MPAPPTPEEIAAWPAPNYTNPHTRVPEFVAILVCGLALMLPFIFGRIYIRLKMRRQFGTDDWIILAAAAATIASSGLGFYAITYGQGYHIWDAKPEWIVTYRRFSISSIITFNFSITLPKLSLCFTYLRLFFTSRTTIWFCRIMIVMLVCSLVASSLVTVFQCSPIASYWDAKIKSEYCINAPVFHIATASFNTLTDVLVYLWPVPSIWRLLLPLRERLGVIFVFAIGSSACIAGALRIYYMQKLFETYDFFWASVPVWTTSAIESDVGIVFACMHAIKPILVRIIPGLFNTSKPLQPHVDNRNVEIVHITGPSRSVTASHSQSSEFLDSGFQSFSVGEEGSLEEEMRARSR